MPSSPKESISPCYDYSSYIVPEAGLGSGGVGPANTTIIQRFEESECVHNYMHITALAGGQTMTW
jgi:hypothetical protein